jgi:phage baseplate assembly protein W
MTVISSYSPIGLEVPFTRGNNGYFQQTFDTNSQIKQNLLNFLKTKKGERRMFPQFGTKLYDVVFEQIDENTTEITKNIINEEIKYWMPDITIKKITVSDKSDVENTNGYKLYISLDFIINKTKETDTVVLELQNNRI